MRVINPTNELPSRLPPHRRPGPQPAASAHAPGINFGPIADNRLSVTCQIREVGARRMDCGAGGYQRRWMDFTDGKVFANGDQTEKLTRACLLNINSHGLQSMSGKYSEEGWAMCGVRVGTGVMFFSLS
jgi:hypothetical protein